MSHLASLFLLGVATPAPTAAPSTLGAGLIGFSFLLSTVIWAPVLVAVILATVPNPRGRYDRFMLLTAFWTNVGMLLLTLIGYQQFQLFASGVQFEEKLPWLPALGVTYHLGVDGIGISLLLLSGLVGVASVLAATGVRGPSPASTENERASARSAMVAQTPTISAAASPPAKSESTAPVSARGVSPPTPRTVRPPGIRAR